MIYLIWLLRIIHIVAGVYWVGGTLIMTFFVGPAVGALGETGQKFVGHLMNDLKFSNRMAIASGLTILAGGILYALDARAGEAWLRSKFAIGLGIGAAFALVGFVFGMMIGRTTKAMALGSQMQGGLFCPTGGNAGTAEAAVHRFHDLRLVCDPGNCFYGNCPVLMIEFGPMSSHRALLFAYVFLHPLAHPVIAPILSSLPLRQALPVRSSLQVSSSAGPRRRVSSEYRLRLRLPVPQRCISPPSFKTLATFGPIPSIF